MPRIDRLIRKREPKPEPQPLSTWTAAALKAELSRLEVNPEKLNGWQILKRRSEIENEQWRRERKAATLAELH
jgi:hypothetical protein